MDTEKGHIKRYREETASIDDAERARIRKRFMDKYQKYEYQNHLGAVFIILSAALAAAVLSAELMLLKLFAGEGVPVRILAILPMIPLTISDFLYKLSDLPYEESGHSKKSIIMAAISVNALAFICWVLLVFGIFPETGIPVNDNFCNLIISVFTGGHILHCIKTHAGPSLRTVETSRDRLRTVLDRLLAEDGQIVFPESSRRGGAAIMPDGKVRRLRFDRYADVLLKDVRWIEPGACAESILMPASEAVLVCRNDGDINRWAKEIIRDAGRKCRKLRDAAVIADMSGRNIVGVTKTGKVISIRFPENVYTIFDRPDDIRGMDGSAWRLLRKRLLPAKVLAGIKNYYIQEGQSVYICRKR